MAKQVLQFEIRNYDTALGDTQTLKKDFFYADLAGAPLCLGGTFGIRLPDKTMLDTLTVRINGCLITCVLDYNVVHDTVWIYMDKRSIPFVQITGDYAESFDEHIRKRLGIEGGSNGSREG